MTLKTWQKIALSILLPGGTIIGAYYGFQYVRKRISKSKEDQVTNDNYEINKDNSEGISVNIKTDDEAK